MGIGGGYFLNVFYFIVPLSISIFAIPDLSIEQKLIIFLCIFCLWLIIFCIILFRKRKRTLATLVETAKKHIALSRQFDDNLKQINLYKTSIESVEMVILMATYSDDEEKIKKLCQNFYAIKSNLNKEDSENGRDL